MSSRVAIARDGLRARQNGAYAREKLRFLDEFGPPALEIAGSKLDRVYLDLFAGPGLSIDEAGQEFDGSPLRALALTSKGAGHVFTRAYLVNLNAEDHNALERRVALRYDVGAARIPRPWVHPINKDANRALPAILDAVHPRAYVFAFADIEGISELPFTTLQHLSHRHTSVDLYVLFPLSMTVNRLIAVSNGAHTARYAPTLTAYFGTTGWEALANARITDEQSPQLRAGLEDLYLRQLRTLWRYAGRVCDVRRRGDQSLYRMLFATNDANAQRVAQWFAAGGAGRQTTMF